MKDEVQKMNLVANSELCYNKPDANYKGETPLRAHRRSATEQEAPSAGSVLVA